MSKELEALEILSDTARFGGDYGNIDRQAYLILEQALKRNEPMKVVSFDSSSYFGMLGYFRCPKCGEILTKGYYNYCPDCGQRIDWS